MNLSIDCEKWYETAAPELVVAAKEIGYRAVKTATEQFGSKMEAISADTQLASAIGRAGEKYVEDILLRHYGAACMEDVSRVAHSGDLTISLHHSKIMIEVKNYRNLVPSIQVEKFQRDLATTNSAGGVFISLHTSIAGIAGKFFIKYEYVGATAVPTAYVTSDDENIIISAINAVDSLIAATNALVSDIYSRDKMLEITYEAARNVDVLSKARSDMQNCVGAMATMLQKSTGGVIAAEVGLRRAVENMKAELYEPTVVNGAAAHAELSRLMDTKGYDNELRAHVQRVVAAVNSISPREQLTISAWRSMTRRYVHLNSGIGFNMLQKKIEVSIPLPHLSWDIIGDMYGSVARGAITVGPDVSITLDGSTVDMIAEVIMGSNLANQKSQI